LDTNEQKRYYDGAAISQELSNTKGLPKPKFSELESKVTVNLTNINIDPNDLSADVKYIRFGHMSPDLFFASFMELPQPNTDEFLELVKNNLICKIKKLDGATLTLDDLPTIPAPVQQE
jgi:hypothetical protein